MIEIDAILLVGAVVLIAAIIAARIGARVGLPSLLLFLGLGLVMGDSGIGIPFDNADLAQALGFAALVVILAEGGLTTRWSDIRSSTILATLLATVGVGVRIAGRAEQSSCIILKAGWMEHADRSRVEVGDAAEWVEYVLDPCTAQAERNRVVECRGSGI